MTKKQLIAELERLIGDCKDETMPAAAVLSALAGTLLDGSDTELMKIVAAFSKQRILAIQGRWN